MRILLTGATGKVGNAVARLLVGRGDEVVALVRDPGAAGPLLPEGVEVAVGDVTAPATVAAAAQGIEGAFNCMGLYEQWFADQGIFERVNAQGARNVVVAARDAGARRVVHTSTFDVFHAARGGIVRESTVADYPKGTAYERSKQHAEQFVLCEAAAGATEVVIVNPSAVYGPGPWAEAGFDSFFRDVIRGKLPALPPGGLTLAYIDDVAAGHLAAFDHGGVGERYILADGYATNRELAEAAVAAAGRGRVPPTMPVPLAKGLAAAGEGVSRLIGRPPLIGRGQLLFLLWQARADASKARQELGIEFRDWRQGIREVVEWMTAAGKI